MHLPHITELQRNRLDWLLQTAVTAWRLFVKNELQNHAAATSFYFLLSAAPVVFLLMYAMQYLTVLAETSNLAVMFMAALYEQFAIADLSELGLIPQQARVGVGSASLLTLLLSSRGLVNALQSAFRVIFPEEAKRPFVLNWMLPLIVIPLVFGVVAVAVAMQASLNFFLQIEWLGESRVAVLKMLNAGFALLTVWGVIYLAFRRLPLRHPARLPALLVSACTTLTLMALFMLFGVFFRVENYEATYGALGGVVFVLIGAYLVSVAFYFWAQFLYAAGKVDVVALEKLFLANGKAAQNKLDNRVFGRANRLLGKYGRHYADGEALIQESEATREAILLFTGRVGVYKRVLHDGQPTERKLAVLEAGSLFGEMAYLLNEKRTASIRAEGEVTALVLPPEMLEELMRYSAPLSRRIIDTLAQRLMHMNQAQDS